MEPSLLILVLWFVLTWLFSLFLPASGAFIAAAAVLITLMLGYSEYRDYRSRAAVRE